MNPIEFGGQWSKVKFTMGIIDKCGMRGDAMLCVVWFIFALKLASAMFVSTDLISSVDEIFPTRPSLMNLTFHVQGHIATLAKCTYIFSQQW